MASTTPRAVRAVSDSSSLSAAEINASIWALCHASNPVRRVMGSSRPSSSTVVMMPQRAPVSAGALHHLVEHGIEVEARVDPEDGHVERGDALAQRLVLPLRAHTLSDGNPPDSARFI